ncbi:Relaxase/Mobilisation nuclease domain-containing protein [Mucilaginibacter gossypiicola]|uniref:Relaxase/Mobilisation nuclease domain-containing protein n=1 Tax=Mucilaginibacter gossypiicola TaxID=551995 RepID=A0A1H8AYJ0_9SPHI|nr:MULTISPECIES: relaxase/mobilization nuclease domain-containing protein [Mucilaginibacter]UOE52199.1 relaxase/mobilization nuclease domain-containing protein [Mucilaginibacter sp. SMC90]SEM75812.1 Relaxase/Mobilisation nuclease domain-containing protein [Mucilaginibacter gossypiicola]
MIVKILSSAASFPGVDYNTSKMDRNKGELMAVRNFGALQGLTNLRPEDYINYLKMVSATNKAVSKPQFHVTISTEGRLHNKHELTGIAEQWLDKMGYAAQPYLIVFHKDTDNNHIHLVSTRIDKNGKKINSGFEKNRAIQQLNEVVGIAPVLNAKSDIENALNYSYSTKAQFMMILEAQGYKFSENEGLLNIIKYGKVQAQVNTQQVLAHMGTEPDKKRTAQLKAILYKYTPQHDLSSLTQYLKSKHGLILLLHAKGDQPPYGYSVIDHAGKNVFKGSEILALKNLLSMISNPPVDQRVLAEPVKYQLADDDPGRRTYYKAMLKVATNNYPDIRQGLHQVGIDIYERDNRYFLINHKDGAFIPLDQLLEPADYHRTLEAFDASGELESELSPEHLFIPPPIIAESIDDEAINGRNRRRKKHPRTNSR